MWIHKLHAYYKCFLNSIYSIIILNCRYLLHWVQNHFTLEEYFNFLFSAFRLVSYSLYILQSFIYNLSLSYTCNFNNLIWLYNFSHFIFYNTLFSSIIIIFFINIIFSYILYSKFFIISSFFFNALSILALQIITVEVWSSLIFLSFVV